MRHKSQIENAQTVKLVFVPQVLVDTEMKKAISFAMSVGLKSAKTKQETVFTANHHLKQFGKITDLQSQRVQVTGKLPVMKSAVIAEQGEDTNMRYFEIEYNDLSYEKQQEMLEAVKEDWIEALKQEGRQEILSQRTNREGITNETFWRAWQKEHNCTDDQLILVVLNELYDWEEINKEETIMGKVYPAWEWNEKAYKSLQYDMENLAEEKAEEACQAGVHNMEIEVETP